MSFMKKLFGKTSSEQIETTELRENILCSNCGKSLKRMGNHGEGDPAFDYWQGNVCLSCRSVFCPRCIATNGPTPCPNCASPTKPAHRHYLAVIFGSSELIELFKPYMPDVDVLPSADDFFTKTREALEARDLSEFARQAGLDSLIAEESKNINLATGQRQVAITQDLERPIFLARHCRLHSGWSNHKLRSLQRSTIHCSSIVTFLGYFSGKDTLKTGGARCR